MKLIKIKTHENFFSELFTNYPFTVSSKLDYASCAKDTLDSYLKKDTFKEYNLDDDSKIFAKVNGSEGHYRPVALLRLLSGPTKTPSEKSYTVATDAIFKGFQSYLRSNNLSF